MDYGLEKYISIDLGMVQSINYYTGVIFKGFTHGLGFPICSGGRYDNLLKEFGNDMPAMGVAIGINRVMSALERQNISFSTWKVDSLIVYREKGRKRAFEIADELRRQGLVIEMFIGQCDMSDISSYAKDKQLGGVITVIDEESIELFNVISGENVKTTVAELTNSDWGEN
jgi:ATP phosphoribosyltransferase regulatory subunit